MRLSAVRHLFRLSTRSTGSTGRLVVYSAIVGVVGGLGAQAYVWLLHLCGKFLLEGIAGYVPPGVASEGGATTAVVGEHGLWLVPLVTTIGGLLSGLLVYGFAPEAEGHGTDAAIQAFHERGGVVRARVPLIKALSSAFTIGSGGAAGREGPVAQIASGFGSTMASWLGCSPRERRLLTLAGIAAGLSAVFRSPLGTAVFAVEVLYSTMEFESRALIFTIMAAVVGYAVNGVFAGFSPIFHLPPGLTFDRASTLFWFGLLGVLMGLIGSFVPYLYYRTRELFLRLPGPRFLRPTLGGLLLGLLALFVPQVLGGGYGWTQQAIDGKMALGLLLLVALAKPLAMSLTVASGGSGGVFAPTLMAGTCFGVAMAMAVNRVFPSSDLSIAAFGVVGMAAFFSGAARVPIAAMLMVVEMTGGYGLLVPAMLAVLMSYLVEVTVTTGWKWPTLYHAQVQTRGDSPVHHEEYTLRALDLIRTGKARLPREANALRLVNLLQLGTPIPIAGSGRSLCLCKVREGAPAAGVPLSERPFGPKVALLSIMRQGEVIDPTPTTTCQEGDQLICSLGPDAYDEASDSLELIGPPGERAG